MFSIGFLELTLVGVVALLVIGPDRLPGVIREASVWINRLRRYASDVRRDIEDQMHDLDSEEMLANMRDGRKLLDDMQRDLNKPLDNGRTGPDDEAARASPKDRGIS